MIISHGKHIETKIYYRISDLGRRIEQQRTAVSSAEFIAFGDYRLLIQDSDIRILNDVFHMLIERLEVEVFAFTCKQFRILVNGIVNKVVTCRRNVNSFVLGDRLCGRFFRSSFFCRLFAV